MKVGADHISPSHRAIWLGALFWVIFAVIAVLLRGVQWDEAYQHAQVFIGKVVYPEGHPRFIYIRNVFSAQTALSAALLWLVDSAAVFCGIRNVLFLIATAVPVYLLAAFLGRRALWGHLAVVLALNHVLLEFDSTYPLAMWPNVWSNGHIGMGWTIMALALLVGGYRRAAFLMIGLLPAIHLGQAPPIYLLAAAFLAWQFYRRDWAALKKALIWGAIGIAGCVAYAVVHHVYKAPLPAEGAYYSPDPVLPIWQGFTHYYDIHRQPPSANSLLALSAALILGAGAAWVHRHRRPAPAWTWAFAYILAIAAVVLPLVALQRICELPFLLTVWMPFRLINHVPFVLLALTAAFLGARSRRYPGPFMLLGGILLILSLRLLWARLLPHDFYRGYVLMGDWALFALSGGCWAAIILATHSKAVRWGCLLATPFLIAATAAFHQYGALWVCIGGATLAAPLFVRRLRSGAFPIGIRRPLLYGLCAASMVAPIYVQYVTRSSPVGHPSPVAQYLGAQREEDAVLAADPHALYVQIETGHAVVADADLPAYLSYVPALGPAINRLFIDLYGMDFSAPPPAGEKNKWQRIWKQRSAHEWRELGQRYGFDYVVAAESLPDLQLEPVMESEGLVLYEVGGGGD